MKLYFLPAGSPNLTGESVTNEDSHYFVFDDGAMMGMALFYDRETEQQMIIDKLPEYTDEELRNPPFILSRFVFDDFAKYMEEVPLDARPADQS